MLQSEDYMVEIYSTKRLFGGTYSDYQYNWLKYIKPINVSTKIS